jgi:hypothetical protein
MPDAQQQPLTKAELVAALDKFQADLLGRLALAVQDPLIRALLTAPYDDEPYTAEQQRRDAESVAAIERGEGIPHEEILKEFGL